MMPGASADRGPEVWAVDITPAPEKTLRQLPQASAMAVARFLNGALAENPLGLSVALTGELEGWYTARRGHYRVTYQVEEDAGRIVVGRIEHRSARRRGH